MSFDDELAKARAAKEAAGRAVEREAAAEAARRESICRESKAAAYAVLPELRKAIRALQDSTRSADPIPNSAVTGVNIATKQIRLGRFSGTRFMNWQIGPICVPRTGNPTAGNKRSLEEFADEGHWWHTGQDPSGGGPIYWEEDAAEIFQEAIKSIAQYLAHLG